MGFLKRSKSIFGFQDKGKKAPEYQKSRGAPLPSLSEGPEPPAIQSTSQRQTLQRHSSLPVQHITAEDIRELREHIRLRYALDIEIWKQREVKEFARDHCKENMRRSDAVLVTIKKTLQDWDRREFFASEEEYKKFKEIKDRVMSGRKVIWAETPPWEIVKQYRAPVKPPYEMNGRPPSVSPEWRGQYPYPPQQQPPQTQTQSNPYQQRSASGPPYGQQPMRASQQVPGRRPVPPQHNRVVSAPQHIPRFAAPQQSYQAYQPPAVSPRYA